MRIAWSGTPIFLSAGMALAHNDEHAVRVLRNAERIRYSLYGTPQNYAAKDGQSVDRLVRER